MTELVLVLSPDLLQRLQTIADQKQLSLEDCAQQAMLDYIGSWEDFARTVDALETGSEERLVLNAADE